jgi:ketosteroid isomerase-like protein
MQPDKRVVQNAAWNTFMAKLEAAEVEFARGHPENFKALWSHSDQVTLFGALGGPVEVGWEKVAARLDWGSSNYADGVRSREEISRTLGPDFAYLVQKETIEARIGDVSEGRSKQELRVTMVFHQEGGEWRILHRHADTQTERVVDTPHTTPKSTATTTATTHAVK